MKNLFIIIFLFISYLSTSQNTFKKLNEVYKKIYKIDSIKNQLIDTLNISYGNVNMKVKRYKNIIEAEGYVDKSKNLLKINYYLSSNELQAIKSNEASPIMNDLYKQWIFNVEKNKIVNEFTSSTVRVCLPISTSQNLYDAYGYNKKWNAKFMKRLLMKLYIKIKNYR